MISGIQLPDSLTVIGAQAFGACNSLTSVFLPGGVATIGESAFYSCTSLKSVNVDVDNPAYASVDGILYDKALSRVMCCPSGKVGGVAVLHGTTAIEPDAFIDCSSLTSITLPDSLLTIGHNAFTGCRSLTSIAIPAGVATIGGIAFGSCDSLVSISVAPGNDAFASVDGVLYDKSISRVIC
jgi:hypothetical protein